MRRMAELYVSICRKAVNTFPGNLDIFLSVTNNLPNLGLIDCDLCVAEHAFSNRRKACRIPGISANVAIGTGQADFGVDIVRKRDRLLRPAYRVQSE
jgi:hypothetical protein